MITKPKGTYDLYGSDALIYELVEDTIKNYMTTYNIEYIRTPVFEHSELFHRGVGEDTDIVNKETYTFLDRGSRSITLKPEGTAGVVRSLIENKFYGNKNDVLKYYYLDTMYRYERPQSGRNREFTQFGIEFFNSFNVLTDAEVISIGYNILKILGFENVSVNINSLGNAETLKEYKSALKKHLSGSIDKFCPTCQERFNKNVLRILDCKVDAEREELKDAPMLIDFLNTDAKIEFENLKNLLNSLEVEYVINPKIVRGLDYYNKVVFEYISEEGVVLGGGGRYDNLVSNLGGPNIPGVGFALGVDRIINGIKENINPDLLKKQIDVYILSVSEEEKFQALKIAQSLRLNAITTETNTNSDNLKKQFKYADDLGAKFLIILNKENLEKGCVNIKDNQTKEEKTVDIDDILEYLLENL